MSDVRIGQKVEIPEHPGSWTIWSGADAPPGAFWAVSADGQRSVRVKLSTKKDDRTGVVTKRWRVVEP